MLSSFTLACAMPVILYSLYPMRTGSGPQQLIGVHQKPRVCLNHLLWWYQITQYRSKACPQQTPTLQGFSLEGMQPPIWVLRVASSEGKTWEVVDQSMPLPARYVIPWILLPLHPQMWWCSCSILVIVFASGLYHPCVIVLIVWAFLLWLHMCGHFVKAHALILSHFMNEKAVLLTDTDFGLVWNQNLMKWFWEPRMFTCIHTGGQPLLFSVGKKKLWKTFLPGSLGPPQKQLSSYQAAM